MRDVERNLSSLRHSNDHRESGRPFDELRASPFDNRSPDTSLPQVLDMHRELIGLCLDGTMAAREHLAKRRERLAPESPEPARTSAAEEKPEPLVRRRLDPFQMIVAVTVQTRRHIKRWSTRYAFGENRYRRSSMFIDETRLSVFSVLTPTEEGGQRLIRTATRETRARLITTIEKLDPLPPPHDAGQKREEHSDKAKPETGEPKRSAAIAEDIPMAAPPIVRLLPAARFDGAPTSRRGSPDHSGAPPQIAPALLPFHPLRRAGWQD